MRTVAVVGATGSIGTQTVEVVRSEPDRYRITALGANRSVAALAALAVELRPAVVAIAETSLEAELKAAVPAGTEVRSGPGALASLATEAEVVVNGVVGFAGLPVTLAALEAGRRLALANKESLIAAGPIVQRARRTPGAEIVPVDSEHCAVHQCLRSGAADGRDVATVVLTASGGPFRGRSPAQLEQITIDEALAHPTWSMGPKITVDSSTLMNKGLEVIEAVELFGPGSGVGYDQIEVVVHPQSVIHSMVTFSDGATLAQLSMPDMRLPIGYALAYPDRLGVPFGAIDWASLRRLDFEPPDLGAFRCLALAYAAGREGGTRPAQLSGANEVAVEAFLAGRIGWLDIPSVVEATLERTVGTNPGSLDVVLEADREARTVAARVTLELER
ncbi:MAG TPA: 1-deoxy-D-xylulose-5-phosphate reductoisomerase [Acidimicrobiales bacterium]|nr:1-deoxy-D-xylulose-5-phosphate reductoisomerase [Acidimicrobiales bacterium]